MNPLVARCRARALTLAGAPRDGVARAIAYRDMYRASGGSHAFPLIAAHGSVWGARHLKRMEALAHFLSRIWPAPRAWRQRRLAQVLAFAEAMRAINREVFIAHATAWLYVQHCPDAAPGDGAFDAGVLQALRHGQRLARQHARASDEEEIRAQYDHFFRWEQKLVVTPAMHEAVRAFEWPWMRGLMLKPWIRFSYFPRGAFICFTDLSDEAERARHGRTVLDWALACGLDAVAARLDDNAGALARTKSCVMTHFFDRSAS